MLMTCSQDYPLLTWHSHVQIFLDELIRFEGRGHWDTAAHSCPSCNSPHPGVIRCEDCFGTMPVCEACAKARHLNHPFHRIKVRRHLSLASSSILSDRGPYSDGTVVILLKILSDPWALWFSLETIAQASIVLPVKLSRTSLFSTRTEYTP